VSEFGNSQKVGDACTGLEGVFPSVGPLLPQPAGVGEAFLEPPEGPRY